MGAGPDADAEAEDETGATRTGGVPVTTRLDELKAAL